jgi:hypothetical protein
VEVGSDWALLLDTKTMNFGEVRKLRGRAATGSEEDVLAVAASLIAEWEAHDIKTGELLGPPTLETLDRTAPAFGLAVVQKVGEGLAASVPLATTKEPSPS